MNNDLEKETLEQEVVKEAEPKSLDLSKIEKAIEAINERLDKQDKKSSISAIEIKKQAEERVLQAKVEEQIEDIKLENQVRAWEKQKTKLEVRNHMWDRLTNQFINDEIPRSHIRSAMLDKGFNSGLGQMLSLALFRYLAPNNGVSIQDLNAISLTTGENSFNVRNQPKNVIRLHGRLG